MPDADIEDLETPIYDLDMDSLDVVDLSNALEAEYGVEADLDRISECVKPSDMRAYFRELIDAT
jgi:acyl carrier protein